MIHTGFLSKTLTHGMCEAHVGHVWCCYRDIIRATQPSDNTMAQLSPQLVATLQALFI
jgi:hypothetical protein